MAKVDVLTSTKDVTVENERGRAHLHEECEYCGPWIKHWQKYAKKVATKCCIKACNADAEVGAHVRLPRTSDDRVFIVPMCKHHNGQNEQMKANSGTKFVYAAQDACGEASK
ncbi:hypothetical protein LO909_002035 [Aeromonas hydrophila]|nr:hypothetical protein [Aeromonas hydrophila]